MLRFFPRRPSRRAATAAARAALVHAAVMSQADILLRDDPRSSIAWLYRGLARQALGQPAEAFEDLRAASALPDLRRSSG